VPERKHISLPTFTKKRKKSRSKSGKKKVSKYPLPPNLPVATLRGSGLPSRGLFYAKGYKVRFTPFPFNTMHKFTGESEDQVSLRDIISICQRCISVDITKMLYEDFMYIVFLMKIQSLVIEEFTLPASCPHCNKLNEIIAKPTDIEFTDIQIESLADCATKLTYPHDKGETVEVTMLPPTVEYVLWLDDFQARVDKGEADEDTLGLGMLDKDVDISTLVMAMSVKGESLPENFAILEACYGAENYAKLNSLMDSLEFGLIRVSSNCTECKEGIEVDVQEPRTLILPFLRA